MAQQMVEQIRLAERQGAEIEKKAAADGESRLLMAKDEANRIMTDAVKNAGAQAEAVLAAASAECEDIRRRAEQQASDEAASLWQQAEKRMSAAAAKAGNLLLHP